MVAELGPRPYFRIQFRPHLLATEQWAELPALDAKGQKVGLSNEAVGYDSPAHAAQALTQWRASVARCKLGVDIKPPEAAAPVVRYNLEKIQVEPHLPVAANAVTEAVLTVKSTGKKLYLVAVLQQHAQILDIVWFTSPSQPSTPVINGLFGLAATTGKRLAAVNT